MSALIDQEQVYKSPVVQPNAPSNPAAPSANNGNKVAGFGQVGGGPAALVMSILYKIMDVYMEILESYKDISIQELQVQNVSSVATSEATEASGQDQAMSMFMQGIGTALSAGVTALTTVVATKQNAGNSEQLGTEQTSLNSMKSVDQIAQESAISGVSNRSVGALPRATNSPAAINQRITEMTQGRFSANPDGSPNLNEEAIQQMDQGQFDAMKAQLSLKLQTKALDVNNIQETMTRTMTTMNSFGQIGSQITSGTISNIGGGYYTNKKATEDAVVELQRTTNSQANNAVSNSVQQLAKEYDAAVQEIAILKQIQDSSQVR